MQRGLQNRAVRALGKTSFGARNRLHAKAVAHESSGLTAEALGLTPRQRRALGRIFKSASLKSGAAFAGAFTRSGRPVRANKGAYDRAMNVAGPVASGALVKVAALIGEPRTPVRQLRKTVNATLNNARVEDLTAMVAHDLGLAQRPSGAQVIRDIRGLIPKGDWAYGDIAKMKTRASGEQALKSSQLKLLNAGLRLANATWKAGQVHRAAWEGSRSRITPSERGGVYNPYDVLKKKMFNDTYASVLKSTGNVQTAERVALSRVVFEVFKDLKQLTP
jgi:hypothetical protein